MYCRSTLCGATRPICPCWSTPQRSIRRRWRHHHPQQVWELWDGVGKCGRHESPIPVTVVKQKSIRRERQTAPTDCGLSNGLWIVRPTLDLLPPPPWQGPHSSSLTSLNPCGAGSPRHWTLLAEAGGWTSSWTTRVGWGSWGGE
jgi:hypothetical protein